MPDDIRISTRATAAQRRAWQEAAKAMGCTPSDYLRRAVEAKIRADRDEAEEAVQGAQIVLVDSQDAGRDDRQERGRHSAAKLRRAALASALEDFIHG